MMSLWYPKIRILMLYWLCWSNMHMENRMIFTTGKKKKQQKTRTKLLCTAWNNSPHLHNEFWLGVNRNPFMHQICISHLLNTMPLHCCWGKPFSLQLTYSSQWRHTHRWEWRNQVSPLRAGLEVRGTLLLTLKKQTATLWSAYGDK